MLQLEKLLKDTARLLPYSAFASNYDDSDFENCEGREDELIEEAVLAFQLDSECLDFCGCGSPEDASLFIYKVLSAQAKADYDESKNAYDKILGLHLGESDVVNGVFQFALNVLNNADLLEHGTSVYSSWLTEKGKCFLSLLELYFNNVDSVE